MVQVPYRVMPVDDLSRVTVELLEELVHTLGAGHDLVAIHIVKVVLVPGVLLLELRAERVAIARQ